MSTVMRASSGFQYLIILKAQKGEGYRIRPDDPYNEEENRHVPHVPDYENIQEMNEYSDTMSRLANSFFNVN
ncbi:hypothetical protein GCK32_015472 [Trichostrongylus colubriformis]|uniref:Uncharacterized protein n=1 Tax=Trichostrongylus colubriformis TaxID=6319 RepID=A0AAN8FG49_TRICO